MNKYQEALEKLKNNIKKYVNCEKLEQSIIVEEDCERHLKCLQQLVDKEKPYKVKYAKNPLNEQIMGQCVCDNFISSDSNYCRHCGQKLDWKDSND